MSTPSDRRALLVLIAGACIIGVGPILVRWSDAGPAATAFWRLAIALPMLTVLAMRPQGEAAGLGRPSGAMLWAGVFFAADIGCWHYGLHLTSVANATVLSNLTPILVAVVAWVVYRERPSRLFALALALAVGGSALIGLAKGGGGQGTNPPAGDALSTLTAVFYGGYFLFVRQARTRAGTPAVMLWSGVVSAPLLLIGALALGERLTPVGWIGWAACAGLGLMHVTGQGAIAWALGRLPTTLTALVVLVQPVVAALLGWLLLGEAVTPMQALGGAVVLAGVALAQASSRPGQGAAGSPSRPEFAVAPLDGLKDDQSRLENESGRASIS